MTDTPEGNPAPETSFSEDTPSSSQDTPTPESIVQSETIDEGRRKFLVGATTVVGAIGAVGAAVPFVKSLLPSAKATAAAAPIEVDISHLKPGDMMTVEWRGKPVWIVRRKEEHISTLEELEEKLRDPDSLTEQQPHYANNTHRSIHPEILVLVGVCTHLGCAPSYMPELGSLGPDWPGGFYCPCHGSSFDMAGRVYKSVPAPINLEVPPHHYVTDTQLVIGADSESEVA